MTVDAVRRDYCNHDVTMDFVRPQAAAKLTPHEKQELLRDYFAEYRRFAENSPDVLNRKLGREAFDELLDSVGELLVNAAASLSSRPGAVREFLDANPLPASLDGRLPDEFRAFCLALNALKQWVSAEQAATDRYLLGGTARTQCRAAADVCIVSGTPLNSGNVELHHPVRDGRPPIPVCNEAHAQIEGQLAGRTSKTLRGILLAVKRQGNRSWIQLRRGCLDLQGLPVQHSTPNIAASSRTFARQASEASSKSYQELLNWLDENNLGVQPEDH